MKLVHLIKSQSVCLLIFSLLLASISFGQDSVTQVSEKWKLFFQSDIHYKTFLDEQYISPTAWEPGDLIIDHQYEGFRKIPVLGWGMGLPVAYQLSPRWAIVSGVSFHFRRELFERSIDTVIKYHNQSRYRDIYNVLKYDYLYYNLEVPVMLHYSFHAVALQAGSYLSVVSFRKANYTYIINENGSWINPNWGSSKKTICRQEKPFKMLFTVQTIYTRPLTKLHFTPYLAIYCENGSLHDVYIETGINVPLL